MGIPSHCLDRSVLRDAIFFSHQLDDIVDVKGTLSTEERRILLEAATNFNLRFIEGAYYDYEEDEKPYENYKRIERREFIDILWEKTIGVLESPFANKANNSLSSYLNNFLSLPVMENPSLYNNESFKVATLRVIFAGLVQTAESEEEFNAFYKLYLSLSTLYAKGKYIKDGIDLLDKNLDTRIPISLGSSVQLMFGSLFEELDHPIKCEIYDLSDRLLGPLVFNMNSSEEDTSSFWTSTNTETNLSSSYIAMIVEALKVMRDLRGNEQDVSNDIADMINRKLLQFKLGILALLSKPKYSLNSDPSLAELRSYLKQKVI